jgi:hypothetical protein
MRDECIYRERQIAWGPMLGLALAAGVGLPLHLAFDPGAELWPHGAALALGALIVLCLGSLTVEVGGGELRWYFGWLGSRLGGWPGGRVALAEIERIEPCRSRWWEGWGVSHTREGWLYNFAGLSALRVVQRDGKRFRLGSADVAGLQRVLAPRL